jgi:D-alanyl-D-alanine carboxypeptidase (penicillin-binding protein 5/6)
MNFLRKGRAALIAAACLVFFISASVCFVALSARDRVMHPVAVTLSAADTAKARLAWRLSSARSGAPDRNISVLNPAAAHPGAAKKPAHDGAKTSGGDAPDLSAYTPLEPLAEPVPSSIEGLRASIHAKSAILIDATTGTILFEKNADEEIPPASMTKLVTMYTAFHAAANGEITFDDVVNLPPETWAVNIPPGSSLMFLGKGQHVTVRELFIGMAVASGNDAAIAIADHVSGSVDAFVTRMNGEMERIGLEHTHFVEPSGLSEKNVTTAREFADFCYRYITEYPEALRAFHSQPKLEYPMAWNQPEGVHQRTIVQYATNKLLGSLEGCDGLKTGFIVESGYNLALTAVRKGTRFLSVTMGGPGSSSWHGSTIRSKDGEMLIEWAFANYATVKPAPAEPKAVAVFGGDAKAVLAVPATGEAFTAPKGLLGDDQSITVPAAKVEISKWLSAPVEAGQVIGKIEYHANGKIVHTVPLIADRTVQAGSSVVRVAEWFAEKAAKMQIAN